MDSRLVRDILLDRAFVDGIPVVTPAQSIEDAIATDVDPKLVDQAISAARRRGLLRHEALARIGPAFAIMGGDSSPRPVVHAEPPDRRS